MEWTYQLVFLLVSFPGSFSIRFHRNWVLRNKTYFFNDCTNFDETKQKLEQREVRENNINIFKNSHCKIQSEYRKIQTSKKLRIWTLLTHLQTWILPQSFLAHYFQNYSKVSLPLCYEIYLSQKGRMHNKEKTKSNQHIQTKSNLGLFPRPRFQILINA